MFSSQFCPHYLDKKPPKNEAAAADDDVAVAHLFFFFNNQRKSVFSDSLSNYLLIISACHITLGSLVTAACIIINVSAWGRMLIFSHTNQLNVPRAKQKPYWWTEESWPCLLNGNLLLCVNRSIKVSSL